MPDTDQVDVRIEKSLKFAGDHKGRSDERLQPVEQEHGDRPEPAVQRHVWVAAILPPRLFDQRVVSVLMGEHAQRSSSLYSFCSTVAAGIATEWASHWSGEGVSPVYEGFDVNDDGTYNLWFGYMNKNFEEELDIPIGPDNTFEPGGDRGQPTHFAPRRHKDIVKVVVPKDFGKQKIVWKVTVRGRSESIDGTLNPVWQIDRRRTTRGGNDDAIDSNTPPVASIQPPEQTIASGVRRRSAISATDDGRPRRHARRSRRLPPQLYAVPRPPPRAGGAAKVRWRPRPAASASNGSITGDPATSVSTLPQGNSRQWKSDDRGEFQ
jgi:hypothetical protein